MQCAISNYCLFFRTLKAVIDCVVKSNKCFETDPDAWRDANEDGLQLLLLLDLKCYRNKFPNEENLQDTWEAAVTNPGKYVNLLVGQRGDKDLRAKTDKRRTITIVRYGTKKQRTFSWPTIRSRHKRIGLRQGLMKRSTIRSSR